MYGERLKQFRLDKNLSQQELADELNISRETVNVVENDHQEPSPKMRKALEKHFGFDIMNNVVEEPQAPYGKDLIKIKKGDLEKTIADLSMRLVRIEAHIEVYETAIVELQSEKNGDFMKRAAALKKVVQEVSERRLSESHTKYE